MANINQAGELRQCCVTGRWILVPSLQRRMRGTPDNLLSRGTRLLFDSMKRGDCPFCKRWFKMWARFEVTEESLKELQSEGVPSDVLRNLESIKNREIIQEEEFVGVLERAIGHEQTGKFKSQILKHAKMPDNRYTGEFTPGRRPNTPIRPTESGLTREADKVDNWDDDWEVFAIRNSNPLLPEVSKEHEAVRSGEVMFERIVGIGYSDVVVESPGDDQFPQDLRQRHNTLSDEELHQVRDELLPWKAHRPLGVLDATSCQLVLTMLLTRFKQIEEDPRIRYVSIFRNHRPESGATLEHPHSQIVASPIIPAQVADELENARRPYTGFHGRCALCGLLRAELERDRRLWDRNRGRHPASRILHRTSEFVVIHPYASRSPFETWILPTEHQPSFGDIEPVELQNLANVLTWTLGRLYICLDDPAYNMVFKTAPFPAPEQEERFRFYHWYIVIEPQRLVTPGGYELSTAISVNVTPPESEVEPDGEAKWKVNGREAQNSSGLGASYSKMTKTRQAL
jgi:UDPglucose--hexose-1-phosphate uridylyltransferase